MSTTYLENAIESRWKTYLKAIIFVLPAVTAWLSACVFFVPKIKEILFTAQVDPTKIDWLWRAPILLVQYGQSFVMALVVLLILLELFVRGWTRYRRGTVGTLVWMVNVAVILGLALLLVVVIIAATNLMHGK